MLTNKKGDAKNGTETGSG